MVGARGANVHLFDSTGSLRIRAPCPEHTLRFLRRSIGLVRGGEGVEGGLVLPSGQREHLVYFDARLFSLLLPLRHCIIISIIFFILDSG